ncbi:hypothetical protein QTP88_024520 [Uroleucon formosanum]
MTTVALCTLNTAARCERNSTAVVQNEHDLIGDIDIDSNLSFTVSKNQTGTATEKSLEVESPEYHLQSSEELFKLDNNADILKKINFVKQHPIQPTFFSNIRLDLQKLYFRKTPDDKKIARKWLSVLCVNNKLKAIYCPICIAFSSSATTFSLYSTTVWAGTLYSH